MWAGVNVSYFPIAHHLKWLAWLQIRMASHLSVRSHLCHSPEKKWLWMWLLRVRKDAAEADLFYLVSNLCISATRESLCACFLYKEAWWTWEEERQGAVARLNGICDEHLSCCFFFFFPQVMCQIPWVHWDFLPAATVAALKTVADSRNHLPAARISTNWQQQFFLSPRFPGIIHYSKEPYAGLFIYC